MERLEKLDYAPIETKEFDSEKVSLGINELTGIHRLLIENKESDTTDITYSMPNKKKRKASGLIAGTAGLLIGYFASMGSYKLNQDISPIILALPLLLLTPIGYLWGETKGAELINKNEIIEQLKKYEMKIPRRL